MKTIKTQGNLSFSITNVSSKFFQAFRQKNKKNDLEKDSFSIANFAEQSLWAEIPGNPGESWGIPGNPGETRGKLTKHQKTKKTRKHQQIQNNNKNQNNKTTTTTTTTKQKNKKTN